MSLHVASYVRQSSSRASGSEASPASQREANAARYETYAADMTQQGRPATFLGHYEDLGISAYSGKGRPDFERLLRDCRLGRVNVIIVYNISRLSRLEPLDALPIVDELMSLDVTIISVSDGVFDPGDTRGLIHLIFRLDAAHKDSADKSRAVKDAARLARSLGGYVGGKAPYGRKLRQEIRTTPGGKPVAVQVLDVNQAEADTIRRVVKLVDEGTSSIYGICKKLNEEGIATLGATRGKKTANSAWHPRTLLGILRHPHVAGFDSDPIYAPEPGRKVAGHRIRRDDRGQPLHAWEPLIEPADWFALQEWLDSRATTKHAHEATALLTSMNVLYCTCGATMSASNAARAASYFCNRPPGKPLDPEHPGDHAGRAHILRADLEDHVTRSVFTLIQAAEHDDEAQDILKRVAAHYAEITETAEVAQERTALLHERVDALRRIRGLHDDRELYQGDPISRERRREDLKAQLAGLRAVDARLTTLSEEGALALPIGEWLKSDPADPMGSGSWWKSATRDERRKFVRLFVKRITVRKALPSEKSRGNKAKAVIAPRVRIEWV